MLLPPSDAVTLLLPVQSDFTGGGRATTAGHREKGTDHHPGHLCQGGDQLQRLHRRLPRGRQVVLRQLPGLQLFCRRRQDPDRGRGQVISEDDQDARGQVPGLRRALPASVSTRSVISMKRGWESPTRNEYLENTLCLISAVVMQMCFSATRRDSSRQGGKRLHPGQPRGFLGLADLWSGCLH